MDTKEKVRSFIINKIASVINGITDSVSKDMDFNNKEHMKLKDSLLRITDKQIADLTKELDELFNTGVPEWINPKGMQPFSLKTKFELRVSDEARAAEMIPAGTTYVGPLSSGVLNVPREPQPASDVITKDQIDNPPHKKHKCSSGDRLDVLETKVKELEGKIDKLIQLSHYHHEA